MNKIIEKKWRMRRLYNRFRYPSVYHRIRNLYYKLRYRIIIGFNDTLAYNLGKGKYVDVIRKGNYLDIYNHETDETIRLLPYQYNHGVMVELWKNNNLRFRQHCDFGMFKKMGILNSEKGE